MIERLLNLVKDPLVNGKLTEEGKQVVQQQVLTDFLSEQRDGEWVALSAWTFDHGTALILSFIADAREIETVSHENATRWDYGPSAHWSCGLTTGGGEPPRVELNVMNLSLGKEPIKSARPVVFHRHFDGRKTDKDYFELLQEVGVAHDLHWTPHLASWCAARTDFGLSAYRSKRVLPPAQGAESD